MAESLGGATYQNTRLLSLDLAGNDVRDAGVSHLAAALRLNRTLLVLNLASNGIGDAGATELAGVLSTFELSDDEVVQRRRLQYARRLRASSRQLSGTKLTTASQLPPPTAGPHQRGRKRGGSPADHGKTAKPTGKAGKTSKQSALQDDGKAKREKGASSKLKKSAVSGRGVESSDSLYRVDQPLPADSRTQPLLSVVVLRQSTRQRPTTLVRGNRSLISLNLSRNEIGQAGMTALLDAALPLSRDAVPSDPAMPGLLRLAIHNNRGNVTSAGLSRSRSRSRKSSAEPTQLDATARYLSSAIATRDPLLRHHGPTTTTTTTTRQLLTPVSVNDA